MRKKKIVLIGGGAGTSTITKALSPLPLGLSTVVTVFDDGGSTGLIRRDYGGIALGDFRQCVLAHLALPGSLRQALTYRFGPGHLFAVNTANVLLRAFLDQFPTEAQGVKELHKTLGLRHRVIPVSYDFARLKGTLQSGKVLPDERRIALYRKFASDPIVKMRLSRTAKLSDEARLAILRADMIVFAPGNFFSSLLPHLCVQGFAEAWQKSRASKVWFLNLLAHRGQDDRYSLRDYLAWFERSLGPRPFDQVVANRSIRPSLLRPLRGSFLPVRITPDDLKHAQEAGMRFETADLLYSIPARQQQNDLIKRAPLRHDPAKVRTWFLRQLK